MFEIVFSKFPSMGNAPGESCSNNNSCHPGLGPHLTRLSTPSAGRGSTFGPLFRSACNTGESWKTGLLNQTRISTPAVQFQESTLSSR